MGVSERGAARILSPLRGQQPTVSVERLERENLWLKSTILKIDYSLPRECAGL